MDYQEAKEILKAQCGNYLAAQGYDLRKLIRCPSPDHFDSHPSAKYYSDSHSVHCFACGGNFNIFHLIAFDNGLDPYKQFREVFCIALETYSYLFPQDFLDRYSQLNDVKIERKPYEPHKQIAPQAYEPEQPKVDYSEYFKKVNKNLSKTNYHRGLSIETLNHFNVGYDSWWIHPKVKARAEAEGKKMAFSQRLIIPTSETSYVARQTRPDEYLTESMKQYKKMKVGSTEIFNSRILKEKTEDVRPIFIVEGEIDAMSIYECGYDAIGIGGTSMVNKFLKLAEENKDNLKKTVFIICLDNDTQGQIANDKLKAGFDKLGFEYRCPDVGSLFSGYKDANELLMADKALCSKQLSEYYAAAITFPPEVDKRKDIVR